MAGKTGPRKTEAEKRKTKQAYYARKKLEGKKPFVCPESHPQIISYLCKQHYYPGLCKKKCEKHLRQLLETEPEVKALHEEWLKKQEELNKENSNAD